MPSLPTSSPAFVHRAALRPAGRLRPRGRLRPGASRVVVVGDLVLDVVLAPERSLAAGSDVPGSVQFRAGGSAATTARWITRLGLDASLVCSVGSDAAGRALVASLRADGVTSHVIRVPDGRTGRIGVVVTPGGERSFVTDRAAADQLRPGDLRVAWFKGASLIHVPIYTLIGESLGRAGRRAVELGRAAGALVSLDLASARPLLSGGRRAALTLVREIAPDVLFATQAEGLALLGDRDLDGLAAYGRAVVVKKGARGATVQVARTSGGRTDVVRFDVATRPIHVNDTTGAGDAFDAGFIVSWLSASPDERFAAATVRRAAVAGHKAAARHLQQPKVELNLG